jgi:hypothetical protein
VEEQLFCKQQVVGSNPSSGSTIKHSDFLFTLQQAFAMGIRQKISKNGLG